MRRAMKLYLLMRRNAEEVGHEDEAQGFVVRARNPKLAREYASMKAGDEGAKAWLTPRETTCFELDGVGTPGVVMRDFKRG